MPDLETPALTPDSSSQSSSRKRFFVETSEGKQTLETDSYITCSDRTHLEIAEKDGVIMCAECKLLPRTMPASKRRHMVEPSEATTSIVVSPIPPHLASCTGSSSSRVSSSKPSSSDISAYSQPLDVSTLPPTPSVDVSAAVGIDIFPVDVGDLGRARAPLTAINSLEMRGMKALLELELMPIAGEPPRHRTIPRHLQQPFTLESVPVFGKAAYEAAKATVAARERTGDPYVLVPIQYKPTLMEITQSPRPPPSFITTRPMLETSGMTLKEFEKLHCFSPKDRAISGDWYPQMKNAQVVLGRTEIVARHGAEFLLIRGGASLFRQKFLHNLKVHGNTLQSPNVFLGPHGSIWMKSFQETLEEMKHYDMAAAVQRLRNRPTVQPNELRALFTAKALHYPTFPYLTEEVTREDYVVRKEEDVIFHPYKIPVPDEGLGYLAVEAHGDVQATFFLGFDMSSIGYHVDGYMVDFSGIMNHLITMLRPTPRRQPLSTISSSGPIASFSALSSTLPPQPPYYAQDDLRARLPDFTSHPRSANMPHGLPSHLEENINPPRMINGPTPHFLFEHPSAAPYSISPAAFSVSDYFASRAPTGASSFPMSPSPHLAISPSSHLDNVSPTSNGRNSLLVSPRPARAATVSPSTHGLISSYYERTTSTSSSASISVTASLPPRSKHPSVTTPLPSLPIRSRSSTPDLELGYPVDEREEDRQAAAIVLATHFSPPEGGLDDL